MGDVRIRWSFGLLAVISLIFLIYIIWAVLQGSSFYSIDAAFYKQTPIVQTSSLTVFMSAVSRTLSPGILLFLAVLVAIFLVIHKEKRYAAIFFFSVLLTLLSAVSIKEVLSVERPVGIIGEIGYGFPSVHAAVAAVFFISAIYTLAEHIREGVVEASVVAVGIFLILLTAGSRLYLQVHWLSDVVGGLALGVFWASLFITFFHKRFGSKKNGIISSSN
jgi:undecaprenyl-diphosphatase